MAPALRRAAWLAGSVLAVALPAAPALGQPTGPGSGLYITVPNPLGSNDVTRIKNRVEAARAKGERRPNVVVFDFNPGDRDAGTPDFGPCYDLAKYVVGLHDVKTVGYVHAKVTGHAVLPALACADLVVGAHGALGQIADRPLSGSEANAYTDVVGQSHPAHLAVARKMYDPGVRLRKAEKGGASWYADENSPEGATISDRTRPPVAEAADGKVALLGAASLRQIELSRRTVGSQSDVLEAYGLTGADLKSSPLDEAVPKPFRYVLRGKIDGGVKEAVERIVVDVARQKGNLLFLQLECGGGDLQAARDLAQRISELSEEKGILVVAFVPDRAPDTAAVIALGCSEIVMSKRTDVHGASDEPQEAEFGDFSAVLGPGQNVDFWVASLRALAEARGYPPLLIDGMLRRDVELVRVHRKDNLAVRRVMTEAEVQADRDRGPDSEWVREDAVKPKGQLLKLSATRAEELGLAKYAVSGRDPAEVYAKYGVNPADVRDATPGLIDQFADILRMPVVTVLLVVIGFTGLILELKVPGTVVPGIVAALCFILVFWAHTRFSGQVAVLAGMLFLLGLVLIMLEIFVFPGFGVSGITGVLLLLVALGLVTFGGDGDLPETWDDWGRIGSKMAQYLIGMIGSVAVAFLIARFLPRIPYANRMMLVPPAERDEAAEPALPGAALAASLLGAVGTAVTVLRPAGSVRFGEQFVDVVTDGGYVPAGARVQVVEVEGTRIVVKEV